MIFDFYTGLPHMYNYMILCNHDSFCLQVEFLSCEQAQEWRGWMVLTLIALHYTEMDQVRDLMEGKVTFSDT